MVIQRLALERPIGSERERTSTWWERTRPREERICSNLLSFFFAKLSSTRRIVVERRQDKNNKVELRANAVHPHHRHRRIVSSSFGTGDLLGAYLTLFFVLFWLFDNIIRQGKKAHRLIVARNVTLLDLCWGG